MARKAIVHLNVVGFRSAVAAAKDKSLIGTPFVIAGGGDASPSSRLLALDCSPEVIKEGIYPGTPLAIAEKRIKGLLILPPDSSSYDKMNGKLDSIARRFAPVWENDKGGNLYLDLSGTRGLYGSPSDASSRILKIILEETGLRPAAAISSTKLVSKVASRAIRPHGLIQIQEGTEEEFLAHQDIRLLPGMGEKLLRTAEVTGIREIWDIARLSIGEASSLFGRKGPILREMAKGVDNSRVEGDGGEKIIRRKVEFREDVIDEEVIKGAIEELAETSGFEMRRDKLGSSKISLEVIYADNVRADGQMRRRHPFVLDKNIAEAATIIYQREVTRRIRVKRISLSLEELVPLGHEVDLFEIDEYEKERRLQEAVDKIQGRYGVGTVYRGLVYLASSFSSKGKESLSIGQI